LEYFHHSSVCRASCQNGPIFNVWREHAIYQGILNVIEYSNTITNRYCD
jgi:(2Fe-2S) ferredoxin